MTLQAFAEGTIGTVTRFFGSPEGKAITAKALADQRQATHAERAQTVAEQTRLQADASAKATAYERREKTLAARVADLDRQLGAAREQYQIAAAEHRAELAPIDRALLRCESRLFATRPQEAIETFCAELHALLDAHRLQIETYDSEAINLPGHRTARLWDNGESMRMRTDVITRLQGEARELWRFALTADELAVRFDAMRKQIPALEARPANMSWR